MDDNISEMLKGVMSDPETMSKLMSVAQGIMGSQPSGSDKPQGNESKPSIEDTEPEPKPHSSSPKPNPLSSGNEERIALISAIRPYLSPERRRSADSLIKMLKMMKLADISKLFGN